MSTQANKERDAEKTIARTLEGWIGSPAIQSVGVHAALDHIGEPALFISVMLKSGKDRLPATRAVDLQIALRDALQDIDDTRFPYITFSTPDDSFELPESGRTA
jgi:hypothetical protein